MKHIHPDVEGNVEISSEGETIFIGGNPKGLRSLANLLTFLADTNQEEIPYMPDGERDHTHLQAA